MKTRMRSLPQSLRLLEVDVFGLHPFKGNPLSVVLDADALSSAQMQNIARWFNYSETTFVLKPTVPEADYRVRIFTPRAELPFAGHPSIGTAYVQWHLGRIERSRTRFLQECGAGLLPLQVQAQSEEPVIFVRVPEPKVRALKAGQARLVTEALGIRQDAPVFHVDVGARWLVSSAQSAKRVLALKPNMAALALASKRLDAVGVNVYGWHGAGADAIEVRSFAPADGIDEDPVCGSGNASVAAVLHALDETQELGFAYSARQGTAVGADGRVHLKIEPETSSIQIGGTARILVEGDLRLI
jgi:PhzF family phenazine biosynthesis protein